MSLPISQPIPDENEPNSLPPARKRRGRRQILPTGADQRAAFLDDLAHRATPSFDFFLFSLLCGAIFGAGFLLDAPALHVLAALLAPFMGPVIGLSLATIIGSGRFFFLTFGGSFTGAALAFASSALVGLIPRIWPELPLKVSNASVRFDWSEMILLGIGVIITTLSMVRSEKRPVVPSVALAYTLYLPVAAAGFGLASGRPHLWPDGLIIYLVYLTGSILLGTIVLAIVGFRPLNLFGYTLGTTITLTSLVILIGLSGIGTALQAQVALPASPASPWWNSSVAPPIPANATPTPTIQLTPTETAQPEPPTATFIPTHTLVPSRTPTLTATLAPTPVWAAINAESLNGAFIRKEPKPTADIVTSLLNGTLVQVLPEIVRDGNTIWAHVRTSKGQEGWIWQGLLVTATPAPGW
ncbi:MAG TPA: DUF389 domain-containing protein [Anaerolineaceae bacterium]|nr:DUF389 domain-containing protein [Anaerolineaceae bacterium]